MSASTVRYGDHGNRTRSKRMIDSCDPQDGFIVSDKAWCSRTNNGTVQAIDVRRLLFSCYC